MIEINIDSEYIKLDQLLKLADAVSTGGHAKFLILECYTCSQCKCTSFWIGKEHYVLSPL